MSEPQWIHGDPTALSLYACSVCDATDCSCNDDSGTPDRMWGDDD